MLGARQPLATCEIGTSSSPDRALPARPAPGSPARGGLANAGGREDPKSSRAGGGEEEDGAFLGATAPSRAAPASGDPLGEAAGVFAPSDPGSTASQGYPRGWSEEGGRDPAPQGSEGKKDELWVRRLRGSLGSGPLWGREVNDLRGRKARGQSQGTRSEFSPKAPRGSPARGGVCVCAHVCVCPRVSACVCKVDKGVRLPRGRCEGTSRFSSVRGGDLVPETGKLNWRGVHGRPQLSCARSHFISPNCFLSFPFLFFFFKVSSSRNEQVQALHWMLFGSECSSCEVASPSRQSAQTLAAKGPGAQPDQFYANERSLGEDLPRGGGSGVTCQFRGRNGHFTLFHSSALCLPFAVEGKVQLSEESE